MNRSSKRAKEARGLARRRTAVRAIAMAATSALLGCPPQDHAPSASADGGLAARASSSPSASSTVELGTSAAAASGTAPPYAGPTGTLRGTVRIRGDDPPPTGQRFPSSCSQAAATYGRLFRVGPDGALADALVTVTHYQGHVPAAQDHQSLTARGCAWSARTVALTLGQHLEVQNLDTAQSYLPVLEGARAIAKLVAVPGGEPVKLFVSKPGRYRLVDQMGKRFMTADVFVLRYATADVTGPDGRYRIAGIPVGKAEVHALLPAAKMKRLSRKIEIRAGDNVFDLTLDFEAAEDAP